MSVPPPPHWVADQDRYAGVFYGCGTFISYTPPRPQTEEEREANARQARLFAKRQEEAHGAEERAQKLLKIRLGRWEWMRFQTTNTLTRRSRLWKSVLYVIRRGHMIRVIDKGRLKTELCVVAGQGEPEADRIMSILDLIESGKEAQLWEMANIFQKGQAE